MNQKEYEEILNDFEKAAGIISLPRNKMNSLQVFKLDVNAVLPTRTHTEDAGVDLYSLEDVFIPTNETRKIRTGVAIRVPNGFVGKVEDRSGTAAKGLRTGAGIVDSGYNGEVGVVMHNLNNTDNDERDKLGRFTFGYQVKKGDRIAQLLLHKIEVLQVEEVKELWTSDRGNKGFNSSGR